LKSRFLAAALAAIVTSAAAAAPPEGPGVADPQAPVPRMAYRSVFQDTPAGVEADALDWKKANAEVGRFPRGHVDLLKWEESQGAPPAPSRAPGVAPAAPPAAAPQGHKH
jgi:hypothetical protein